MDKIELPLTLLFKALETLNSALIALPTVKKMHDKNLFEFTEDATIQRFEYCFDSFWKFLKKYLEHIEKIENLNSPRAVFQMCVKSKICSENDGLILISMIADRNETTHNYDADKVRKILPRIQGHYDLMKKITDELSKTLELK